MGKKRWLRRLTQAKVGDAHVPLAVQQHVLRLQVPAGQGAGGRGRQAAG